MLFALAIAYLALPVFVLLFTFFSTPFVVLSGLALVVLVFCLFPFAQSQLNYKSLLRYHPLILVSLLITYVCLIPFEGVDWSNYVAAFNLLEDSTWPPIVEYHDATYVLRYYLGWFMLPALVSKVLGEQYLTGAMFVWTALGVIIVMLLAFRHLKKAQHLFFAPFVFFLFSGLDLVGAALVKELTDSQIYWLNGWGGRYVFEIFSNISVFSYSPQHAIGVFLTTSLFLFQRRLAVQYGAVLLTINAMWSTFGTVGVIPIAMWALWKEGFKTSLTLPNLLIAPMLVIPIVLYLTQGAHHVPAMFSWQDINFHFPSFVLFCILEFLLIAGVLYWLLKEDRSLIATLAVFLTILCMFKVGGHNNLLYRGAMSAICVMGFMMFKALLTNRRYREVLLILFIIGAIPPAITAIYRLGLPKVSNMDRTIQEHYDMRAEEYETFQYLVYTDDAVHVLGVPLLRGLPVKGHRDRE